MPSNKFLNALASGALTVARPRLGVRKYTKPIGPRMANRKFYKTKVGSATAVQRKRRNIRRAPLQNPGGIITQSVFTRYNKASFSAKVRKNASNPNYEILNGVGNFEALSGFQSSMSHAHNAQGLLLSAIGKMPTPVPAGNFTRRMLLESYQRKTMFTNASSAGSILELYDIVTKQDNDLDARNAWIDGITMETTLPAGTPPYNVLGVKLWHSQRFNEFFKVVKKTIVNLAPGASHQHAISLKPNLIIKEQRIRENVSYRGLTYFTIAVVKGVPVCDDADVPRLVSTAPIKIDWVSEVSTKYRWVNDIDTDLYITNGLTTLIQPEVMNTFGSAPLPVTSTA